MMREKTPLLDEFVCIQIGIKDFYYFSEKLLLSQNLCYFRGSRFSKCFIPSTALPCSVTKSVFKLIFVSSSYQTCTFPSTKNTTNVFGKVCNVFHPTSIMYKLLTTKLLIQSIFLKIYSNMHKKVYRIIG